MKLVPWELNDYFLVDKVVFDQPSTKLKRWLTMRDLAFWKERHLAVASVNHAFPIAYYAVLEFWPALILSALNRPNTRPVTLKWLTLNP